MRKRYHRSLWPSNGAVLFIMVTMIAASPVLAAGPQPGRALVGHGYAGMSTNDSLVVFDLATGTALAPVIDLLPEGNYPYDATIHPAGHELWVVGASGDGVVVVDTASATIAARIALGSAGEYPVDIIFGLDGDLAYVSSRDSDTVLVIDVATHTPTGDGVAISSSGLGPGKMALNPVTGKIHVVDWYGTQLHVIDPVTLAVTSQVVGSSLWDLTFDPSATNLYVADRGSDEIHVLDADDLSLVTSIAVGDDPWGLDLTPDAKLLFVANEDSHEVSVIDAATNLVTATIALGSDADPRDVDISEDGSTAYVPSGSISGDDGIFVIDVGSLTLVDTISMGGQSNPNVVAVAPQGGIFADGFESGDSTAWSATVP
ncbi:MAG: YncE family protein [bacterium]|nr:YncE family protein [bacterium]